MNALNYLINNTKPCDVCKHPVVIGEERCRRKDCACGSCPNVHDWPGGTFICGCCGHMEMTSDEKIDPTMPCPKCCEADYLEWKLTHS